MIQQQPASGVHIKLERTGAVTDFEFQMDQPGVYEIKGKHGVGKSTTLRWVEFGVSGRADGDLVKQDNAMEGRVTINGKTVRVMKKTKEEGQLLGVEGLGDLDIGVLHSPKLQTAAGRDRKRIEALLSLLAAQPDISNFHDLLGGKEPFEKVVNTRAVASGDVVEMAALIKRELEKAARAEEAGLETAKSNMLAQQQLYAGVDLEAPHDEPLLQRALTDAIQRRAGIQSQRKAALTAQEQADLAQDELNKIAQPQSIEDANRDLAHIIGSRKQCESVIADLEQKLQEAQADLKNHRVREMAAEQALLAAQKHVALTAAWRQQIKAGRNTVMPSLDELRAAEKAEADANAALELGRKVRDALQARDKALDHGRQADDFAKAARRLRDAAGGVEVVLSRIVAGIADCPLKIYFNEAGEQRLVLATNRSEKEPFDDLSDGERWKVILPLAAKSNRLITLPQPAYGELAPSSKRYLHKLAQEVGCFILTAVADDGEMRVEMFEEQEAQAAAA